MMMYRSLTSLRGLFAVAVVLCHRQVAGFDHWAHCAVVFFFMLSGFLLTLRHNGAVEGGWGAWGRFVEHRARRVYPLHLAAWAVYVGIYVAFSVPLDWKPAVLNALLLHAWVPRHDYYLSVNGPVWFLSALMLCYACHPLLCRALRRVRLRWQVLGALVVACAMCGVMPLLPQDVLTYAYFCPPLRLLDFVLGMVLARLLRALPTDVPVGSLQATASEVSAVVIVFVVWALSHYTDILQPCEDVVVWWLPVAVLIVTCAAHHGGGEGWLRRMLSWRPLVWLGEVSQEIYVLHCVVPLCYAYCVAPVLYHYLGLNVPGLPIAAHLGLLLVVAAVVHTIATHRRS